MPCNKSKEILTFNQTSVELVDHTFDPIAALVRAIRICRLSESDSEWKDGKIINVGTKDLNLIKFCIDNGHTSVLEMVEFTFMIHISTVAHKHLIRHRMSSFAAESERFVDPDTVYKPQGIERSDKLNELYMDSVISAFQKYYEMLACGATKDEARYVLPQGAMGGIIYKANLRSLRNAIGLRTCKHATSEIQSVFKKISKIVQSVNGVLVYNIEKHISCKDSGTCGYCRGVIK